jgi:prophage regulatory protein
MYLLWEVLDFPCLPYNFPYKSLFFSHVIHVWRKVMVIQQKPLSIIRRKEVEARTGLSSTTIYDRLDSKSSRYDESFPKPISLGGRSVGWIEAEIVEWIQQRISLSRAKTIEDEGLPI